MIVDAIKNHLMEMMIFGLMFLAGVGVGSAITDAIVREKGEKKNDGRTNQGDDS